MLGGVVGGVWDVVEAAVLLAEVFVEVGAGKSGGGAVDVFVEFSELHEVVFGFFDAGCGVAGEVEAGVEGELDEVEEEDSGEGDLEGMFFEGLVVVDEVDEVGEEEEDDGSAGDVVVGAAHVLPGDGVVLEDHEGAHDVEG